MIINIIFIIITIPWKLSRVFLMPSWLLNSHVYIMVFVSLVLCFDQVKKT